MQNAKQIVALSYAQLESKPQIKNDYYGRATQRANLRHKETRTQKNLTTQNAKNVKLIAAASYATPKQRAALSHKDTRDSSNLMPWAPGSGRNARRSADVMRIAPIDQLVYG